ncbi:hypothetical protein [Stenotrophomonas acidaminiphila]|uniref:hypothetical protein n=1 Tax=Stenotrophomonas acidaminiphila TaxID=128780 RepID=UPI003D06003A
MNAHNEQQALPCPFCGREPDLSFNSVSCGCAASPFIDREDALQVWNTRAAQPSPVVKQNLTTAAAQEAVLRIYAEGDMRVVTEWLDGSRDLPDGDHRLYAAPVTAAPVLYGVPDGKGGVKLGKGWAFSKEPDRALGTTQPLFTEAPAAPGIDLARFRAPVLSWIELNKEIEFLSDTAAWAVVEGTELLALIDASPKGGSEAPTYTTGHCENHKKPGGCPLHNLQCGYPQCDRQPASDAEVRP